MPPDDVADFRALDDADPGEGYACYGGPGGDVETLISARWLGAWAPGTGASRLPEGYGIEVAPGSVIAFQVHYNTATRSPAPDQSALELQIETTPQDWAAIQPFADPRWVLGVGMDIPANTQGVEHSFAYVNDDGLGPIRLHSGLMHMHTLGRSGRIEVEHPDGSRSCVLSMPRYSFDWQRTYTLATPRSRRRERHPRRLLRLGQPHRPRRLLGRRHRRRDVPRPGPHDALIIRARPGMRRAQRSWAS